MIRLWKGFHSKELLGLIRNAWDKDELLIVCPPGLKDFSFVDLLPEGELKMLGDWDDVALPSRKTSSPDYPEKPVLGVFTSGTTCGTPRLVLYSKSNLEFSLAGIRSFFDTNRFDSLFCYPQPLHTFGLVLGYVHSLLYDLQLVIPEGKYSRLFHDKRIALRSERVLTLGTPVHFFDLIQHLKTERQELHPSYACILGGARVSVPLWHAVRDELKIEAPSIGYGATEASPGVTHQAPGHAPLEEGEIGKPIPGVSVRVLPGDGIEFSGPNVCLAIVHLGKIEFPKKVLLRDEIRTRSDSILIYEGRNDLVLNRGGMKFSLERIEEVISVGTSIDAVCVSVPDERLGEELGILIRTQGGSTSPDFQKAQVFSLLKKEFGQSFNPFRLIEVDQFPLNASSKVDRKRGSELF